MLAITFIVTTITFCWVIFITVDIFLVLSWHGIILELWLFYQVRSILGFDSVNKFYVQIFFSWKCLIKDFKSK